MDDPAPRQPAPPAERRPAEPTRGRRRGGRRLLHALIGLVVLLLVLALVVQIVLWTNVPRNLVLKQLEKQLGLRVGAASLTTGWSGNTQLRDVSIALPLSDEALLTVPEMRVKHTSLLGLLWTRAVTLRAIELDRPTIVVRQDETGRWNLEEVADLLARTGGKEAAADQAKQTSRPTLPSVRLREGTVIVYDRGGRTTTVAPLNVVGDPESSLTWKYEVAAGDVAPGSAAPGLRLTGRLAVGGTWEHDVDMWAANVEQWAKPWAGDAPPKVGMAGEWRGELKGGVVGRLVIGALDVADVHSSGALAIAGEGGKVAVRPEDLLVRTPSQALPEFRLTAGKLALDGKSVGAEGLTVQAFGGVALLGGSYDWAKGSADLKAEWSDFALPGENLSHRGSVTATLRQPFPGRPVVEARLLSSGATPTGKWDANVALGASGRGWRDMDWRFQADRLSFTGARPVRLDGLGANVETRGDVITLTSLRGPGEVAAKGQGRYNLADGAWEVRLDLSNLPRAVTLGRQTPVAITFSAWGNNEHIRFDKPGLLVRGAEAELRANGWYYYDKPNPLDLDVYVDHVPPRVATTDDPPLFGYLRGEAHLSGTVFAPRDITIKGNLIGRGVQFLDRPIGDITAAIGGKIDGDLFSLESDELELLGGRWQVDALFPQDGVLGLNLTVKNLPLTEVAAALKRPDVEGTIDARWAFIVPRLEAEAVKVTADLKARDVKLASLRADTAEATVVLADGTLRAAPVRLRKDDGTATLSAEMDLNNARQFTARLALAAWPFEPSEGNRAELWGGTRGMRVTLPGGKDAEGQPVKLGIDGPLDVSAALTLKDQPLGDAHVLADFRGRLLDLRSLSFDGLDGNVQGQALIDLDRPFDTRGSLFWEDFNAARVPEFFPDNETLVGLTGRLSGSARVAPAPGDRPLEPLRVQAFVDSQDFAYRTITLGDMRLSAFTNLDRVVVEDSLENPTTIAVGDDGVIRVWGRMSTLEPGDEITWAPGRQTLLLGQLQVAFERLNLDQIVHAFAPEADPMPGLLAGGFTAIAGTRPRRAEGVAPSGQGTLEKVFRRITADGKIEVTESNLDNLDAVHVLYNALSFVPAADSPDGRGDLTFHMEDGLLSLNNVHYFNRGIELRAVADIPRAWEMPDSPLEGTAMGNLRPFRDLKLPFFSATDVDKVFTALQGDAIAFRLAGTVRDYDTIPLAFKDLGKGMRMLIVGDAAKEKRRAR
jgi:hypothetical protein